jgi:hypothetical protein
MNQVSTNLTLFYRLFLPIFFGVFIGATVIFLWLHPLEYYANLKGSTLRFGLTTFYVVMMTFFLLTVWRLRRVEMGREWVYITDFFRQARYPWTNVKEVTETSVGFFRLVRIELAEPGSFGRKVTFIASGSRWRLFKEEFPDRLADLLR